MAHPPPRTRLLCLATLLATTPLGACRAPGDAMGDPDGTGADEAAAQPGLDDPTARMYTLAGSWYPEDPRELDAQVDGLLVGAGATAVDARVVLTPHAKLYYSGLIAAEAWARVKVPDTVILLSPNHWEEGSPQSIWNEGPWLVPGHALAIDQDLTADLMDLDPGYIADRDGFNHHEAEMQLPFLQRLNPDVKLVVASWWDNDFWDFRDFDLETLQASGEAVAQLIASHEAAGEEVLLLITTDLVHHVPLEQLQAEDPILMGHIGDVDPEGLYRSVIDGQLSICGEVNTAVGLYAMRALGIEGWTFLDHDDSYPAGDDPDDVVGYPMGMVAR